MGMFLARSAIPAYHCCLMAHAHYVPPATSILGGQQCLQWTDDDAVTCSYSNETASAVYQTVSVDWVSFLC